MKLLYYFYSGFNTTFFGILLDEAKKQAEDDRNEVYIAVCKGFSNSCISNPEGNLGICHYCSKFTVAQIRKQLGQKVKVIDLIDYDKKNKIDFRYINAEDIKKIEYKSAKIGYSTLSSYIQLTRNQNPLINGTSKIYFDNQLNQALRLVDAFEQIIENFQPDSVISYNGRFNEIRTIFDTCKRMKINVEMLEAAPSREGKLYKVSFNNVLPHNVKDNLWRIDLCWKNPSLKEGENVQLANQFFQNRRNGSFAGDKIYINDQVKGALPEEWNTNKRNIAIFNSSEDEFVAIGDEYQELALFPDQYSGLAAILERFKDDSSLHFNLRIHPNLKNVKYNYHTKLYDLPKQYSNITVIGPESSVSTYDLMEASEKVIVFGSTMGIESAYWGKPAILLNCAMYYYADVCYIPKTPNQLFDFIQDELYPKKNENILKLGLYYFDKSQTFIDSKTHFQYVNFNPESFKVIGKQLNSSKYIKILGSAKLASLLFNFKRLLMKYSHPKKFTLPRDEAQ